MPHPSRCTNTPSSHFPFSGLGSPNSGERVVRHHKGTEQESRITTRKWPLKLFWLFFLLFPGSLVEKCSPNHVCDCQHLHISESLLLPGSLPRLIGAEGWLLLILTQLGHVSQGPCVFMPHYGETWNLDLSAAWTFSLSFVFAHCSCPLCVLYDCLHDSSP